MTSALLGISFLVIALVIWLAPSYGVGRLFMRLWRLDQRAQAAVLQPGPIELWGRIEKQGEACVGLFAGPSVWMCSTLVVGDESDSQNEGPSPPAPSTSQTTFVPSRFVYGDVIRMAVALDSLTVIDVPSEGGGLSPASAEQHSPEFVRKYPYCPGRIYGLKEEVVPDGASVLAVGTLDKTNGDYLLKGTADGPLILFVGSRRRYWGRMLIRLGLAALLSLVITLMGLGLVIGEILRALLISPG